MNGPAPPMNGGAMSPVPPSPHPHHHGVGGVPVNEDWYGNYPGSPGGFDFKFPAYYNYLEKALIATLS